MNGLHVADVEVKCVNNIKHSVTPNRFFELWPEQTSRPEARLSHSQADGWLALADFVGLHKHPLIFLSICGETLPGKVISLN